MSDPRSVSYTEAHSALNWPLLACGLFVPAAAEITLVILGAVLNPAVVLRGHGLLLFVPVLICISLLYRNWPTGIRFDASAISIGAVGSARAARRTPDGQPPEPRLVHLPVAGRGGHRGSSPTGPSCGR